MLVVVYDVSGTGEAWSRMSRLAQISFRRSVTVPQQKYLVTVSLDARLTAVTTCVIAWLALRGSRPHQRAVVLSALAEVFVALAVVLHRNRRN